MYLRPPPQCKEVELARHRLCLVVLLIAERVQHLVAVVGGHHGHALGRRARVDHGRHEAQHPLDRPKRLVDGDLGGEGNLQPRGYEYIYTCTFI